jgi:phage terminase Nu1 subunit (DNA packaging protein)
MTTLNRADFAALLGVTGPAVRQWMNEGMPAQRTGIAGNAGYQIDSVAALQWLFDKRIKKAVKAERRRMERVHNLIPELDAEEMAKLSVDLEASMREFMTSH